MRTWKKTNIKFFRPSLVCIGFYNDLFWSGNSHELTKPSSSSSIFPSQAAWWALEKNSSFRIIYIAYSFLDLLLLSLKKLSFSKGWQQVGVPRNSALKTNEYCYSLSGAWICPTSASISIIKMLRYSTNLKSYSHQNVSGENYGHVRRWMWRGFYFLLKLIFLHRSLEPKK